jgi:hypothetical protein
VATVKRLAFFYLLALVLLGTIYLVYGWTYMYARPVFYLFPLLMILPGQALGFMAFLFYDDEKKRPRVYKTTAWIGLAGILLVILYNIHASWIHERDYGNIEANESFIRYLRPEYAMPVQQAFAYIESKEADKNDIKMVGYAINPSDTLWDGRMETIYNVSLFYERKFSGSIYQTKVNVLRNECFPLLYNHVVSGEELRKMRDPEAEYYGGKAWEMMPDSLKHEIDSLSTVEEKK